MPNFYKLIRAFFPRRSLPLTGLILLLGLSLVIPSTTVSAWSGAGDPSELSTATSGTSCSIQFEDVASYDSRNYPPGSSIAFAGICTYSDDLWAASRMGRTLASGLSIGDVSNVNFLTSGGATFTLRNSGASSAPILLTFESGPCDGVVQCAEFSGTHARQTSSTYYGTSIAPAQDELRQMNLTTVAGDCSGGGSYCRSSTGETSSALDPLYFPAQMGVADPSDAPMPPEWYWNAPWMLPPVSACEGVEYALQVNGTGYDLVQLQDVFVYPTDKIILIVDMNGGYPADLNALSFKYRAQPQDLFFRQAEFVDQALDEIFTYKIEVKDNQPAALIEVECTDNAFVTDYTTLGDMNHNPVPHTNRACASLVVRFPDGYYEAGESVSATFELDAGPYVDDDTGIDVQMTKFDIDDGVSTTSVTDLVESFDRFGSQIGGFVPWLHEIPIDSEGTLVFLMPAAGEAGRLSVVCTDTTGSYNVKGSGTIVDGTFVVTISSGGRECYKGTGMDWKHPSTWPIGFVRAFGCLAEDLTLPDTDEVQKMLIDAQDEIGDKPPFLFFTAVLSFADEVADGYGTSSSGCFSTLDIEAGGQVFSTADACLGDGITVEPEQRSTMALFIIGPIYLAIASHALGMVREK